MTKGIVLILGARSDIGMAVAHIFAKNGYSIQLAARQANTLNEDQSDLMLRYKIGVTVHEFDALDVGSHVEFVDSLPTSPDIVVCAVGYMCEQTDAEQNWEKSILVMRSNYEGPVSILSAFANKFESCGFGTLVGISSVAGERGRANNYMYGSAKAGFTTFLSGLRNRLSQSGVHVITVLPGFVYTRMTQNLALPKILTADTKEVAKAIFNAVTKKHNIVYSKPIWLIIMLIIRLLPEVIFKKMKI